MKIVVNDFRRIREAKLDCQQPVTLLVGKNQSGKSSVLGAVQVALTGKHPRWLSRQGDSLYDLRREGAKKAHIRVTIGDLTIGRLIKANGQELQCYSPTEDGNDGECVGTTTQQQAALCDHFGLTAGQLTCLLDAGQFLAMSAKEQVTFLASMSGAELTQASLTERLIADGWSDNVGLMLAELGMVSGVELLDAALKWATEGRKDAKRVLGEKQTLLGVAEREAPEKPTGDEPDNLPEKLDELVERETKCIRLAGQIEQADSGIARAQEAVEQVQADLANALGTKAPVDDLDAAKATLAPLEAALRAASDAETMVIGTEHDARLALSSAARQEEEWLSRATNGKCPTCNRGWDVDEAVQAMATASQVREGAAGVFRSATDELEAAQATTKSALEPCVAQRTTVANLERQVSSAERSIKQAEQMLVACNKQLAADREARSALGEPEAILTLQVEVEALQAWADWKLSQQTLAELRTKVSAEEKSVETWEWLVMKFASGPDSYRAELLEGRLDSLKAAVNEALSPLLHETVLFPEGDQALRVQGEGYTYAATDEFMSGSQKLRLQIALQYGFCKALEFPLMLVDCEAALDCDTTAAILTFLRKMAATVPSVHAVVAMAPTRPDWRKTIVAGAERYADWADVYAVVDGWTERLMAEQTAAPQGA